MGGGSVIRFIIFVGKNVFYVVHVVWWKRLIITTAIGVCLLSSNCWASHDNGDFACCHSGWTDRYCGIDTSIPTSYSFGVVTFWLPIPMGGCIISKCFQYFCIMFVPTNDSADTLSWPVSHNCGNLCDMRSERANLRRGKVAWCR